MHGLALTPLSEHEWLVSDDETPIGVVEEHSGDFEAVIGEVPSWHPHFDSLDAATEYFSEYASALHLGVG
jgi:hypothetical protein